MVYDLMSRIPDSMNRRPFKTSVSKKTIFVSELYGTSEYKLQQLMHRFSNVEKKSFLPCFTRFICYCVKDKQNGISNTCSKSLSVEKLSSCTCTFFNQEMYMYNVKKSEVDIVRVHFLGNVYVQCQKLKL